MAEGSEPQTVDLVFVPYVERMNASLAYYKGYRLRAEHLSRSTAGSAPWSNWRPTAAPKATSTPCP